MNFQSALLRFWWLMLIAVVLISCTRAPYTGREQVRLVPSSQMTALGEQAFRDIKQEYPVSSDTSANAMLQRVGRRIAAVTEQPEYNWEFVLLEDNAPNAFALPGGKIGIFTGILPYTQNEAGLATVVSHEMAHVIARHANERVSQALLAEVGEQGLAAALQGTNPAATQTTLKLYGVGTKVGVLLPYSRTQESEADHIGLILMAKAGYNPAEAINFWQRMLAAEKGAQPPVFLSTHPAEEDRISSIREKLPEAQSYYRP